MFQQDTGGNELWDIFAIPADGGVVINLTNTPDIRIRSEVAGCHQQMPMWWLLKNARRAPSLVELLSRVFEFLFYDR